MLNNEEIKEIQIFLALLFPWDDDGEQLYKSVSWTFTDSAGKTGVANYAAQSMGDLVRLIDTRIARKGADVYVCLGTQRMASTEVFATDGFPKAIRQHKNMVSYKSLWLDVDVGKEKSYATTDDAFAAVNDFCRVHGLPAPTMTVYSGSGGLHVYWCFKESVPYAHWMPLAKGLQAAALNYGLKFDPQVTVNPAGILRVPNSWNHKKSPPSRVFLYHSDFPRYDYQQLVSVLGPHAGTSMPGPMGNHYNADRAGNFSAGIEGPPPVSIEEVAINCDVIHDILEREGNGDAEPLWNLALYAASFTNAPHDAAHAMSRGDPRYDKDATEKKLLEKINARSANPQAGWPTCESFSMLHAGCATCPLFALKKTPFHHVPTVKPSSTNAEFRTGTDPLMPDGYWRDKRNHVWTTLFNKKGEGYAAEIIKFPIIDGGVDPESGVLVYESIVGNVQRLRELNVSANLQPGQAGSALSKGFGGLYVDPNLHTPMRNFLVAWVGHLQDIKRIKHQGSYGWQGDNFAYDDRVFHADRTEVVYRGKNHDPNFTSCGELKPWQDAMQLVYGHTPLETIVASAFAAPLVEMVGSSSLVLSVYSSHSGVGKTTSMQLGQAVWGHPRSGMSSLADTINSTMKKIADLKSLPIYWDELRTAGQIEKVVDIVFQVTQGKGKARLNKDITQQDAKTFTTMFTVASNLGIADTVYHQTESTEAGGLRVFEIDVPSLNSTSTDSAARQLMIPLQQNYGVAGPIYAEFLATNRDKIKKMVQLADKQFGEELGITPKERFWWMTLTSLYLGAQLANACGLTDFNMTRLRAYLVDQFQAQRTELGDQQYVTLQATQDVVGLVRELLNEARNKHLIITETIPYGMGKPTPNNLVDTDMSRVQNVWMQLGHKDQRVRIRTRQFHVWLREKHLNPKQIIEKLKGHYFVRRSQQTIGAGVPGLDALATHGRTWCYDLTPLPSSLTASSPSHDSDEPS